MGDVLRNIRFAIVGFFLLVIGFVSRQTGFGNRICLDFIELWPVTMVGCQYNQFSQPCDAHAMCV